MNKKILSISIFLVLVILAATCTPAVASPDNKLFVMKNDLVTIEVNHYLGRQVNQLHSTITVSEAEQLRFYLTELNKAIELNDHEAIVKYVSFLNGKGILKENYRCFPSYNDGLTLLKKTKLFSTDLGAAGENISNRLCFFNAIGEGAMLWGLGLAFVKTLVDAIMNVSNPIGAIILLIILLPFIVITMLLNNLIPFRIFSPNGIISLMNGTISARGANGTQRVTVGADPYNVNLSGFTGITIFIPPINNHKSFLFVSGFALKAEGQPS